MHRTALVDTLALITAACVAVLLLVGCGPLDFDPPANPPHTDFEDGYAHALGKEAPYLCRNPGDGALAACPDVRPASEHLSCDAAGCHGAFDYSPDGPRHLEGADGPSCWTCHGQEWSTRVD